MSRFTVRIVMFAGLAGSSSRTTIRLSFGFRYDLGMWYLTGKKKSYHAGFDFVPGSIGRFECYFVIKIKNN